LISPWEVIKDLSQKKERLINEDNVDEYNAFLTNLAFSRYLDTVFDANEMNKYPNIPLINQHDYYFHVIKKRKRYSPWTKRDLEQKLMVAEYFDYSLAKATEIMPLLDAKTISTIIEHAENMKKINTS